MKKLFSCLMMLCTAASTTFAQEETGPETTIVEIGEFKASDKMFNAQAYISKDTSLVYLYRMPATHAYPANFYNDYNPTISIACTPTMKDELQKIAAKYKEWATTAKDNNVGKMQKVIELEFPVVHLSLHKNAKGYPKYIEFKNHKFTFSIYDSQKAPSIFCNETFKDDLTGIPVSTGLAFRTPEEFEAFVEFLDPEKVKQRIREGKTTLFPQDSQEGSHFTSSQTLPQSKTEQSATTTTRVDKGSIARGALNRWKSSAQRGSYIKK